MKKPDKKKILKALKILFGVLVVVFAGVVLLEELG